MTLEVRVDADEVTKALDELDKSGSKKAVKAAVRKGVQFLKPKVKASAPRGTQRHRRKDGSYRGPGELSKRVGFRVKNSKKHRGDVYGVVRSFAGHHHLVVDGTGDRYTRSDAFRGRMPTNSFVSRVADANEDEALRIAEQELARQLEL